MKSQDQRDRKLPLLLMVGVAFIVSIPVFKYVTIPVTEACVPGANGFQHIHESRIWTILVMATMAFTLACWKCRSSKQFLMVSACLLVVGFVSPLLLVPRQPGYFLAMAWVSECLIQTGFLIMLRLGLKKMDSKSKRR